MSLKIVDLMFLSQFWAGESMVSNLVFCYFKNLYTMIYPPPPPPPPRHTIFILQRSWDITHFLMYEDVN
jgi:hypothetical protein